MYIVCRPCSVADDKGHACQVIYAYTLILGTYVSWLLCYAVRINTSWAYYIGTSIYMNLLVHVRRTMVYIHV